MTKSEKSLKESLAQWKLFLYNPTTREFLGRTAKSWGERAGGGQRAGSSRSPLARAEAERGPIHCSRLL